MVQFVHSFSKTYIMTIQEIANRLVELCRKGDFEKAQQELYGSDVISTEPFATPEFEKETKGLKAVITKGKVFTSMVQEMHNLAVSQPLFADNSFAISMTMDVTMKGKERMRMTELCVYEVKDGKIISETFHM